MINIHPRRLPGEWTEGFALDIHSTSSELLGYDEFGHERWHTTRTEVGELLYRLKYDSETKAADTLADVAASFVRSRWASVSFDCVVPVPPSNTTREIQPVVLVATGLSQRLQIPLLKDAVTKRGHTPELKNVYDYDQRTEILSRKFEVRVSEVRGKTVLVFDDLYRSGATLGQVCHTLHTPGLAKNTYVLTLTKTRTQT